MSCTFQSVWTHRRTNRRAGYRHSYIKIFLVALVLIIMINCPTTVRGLSQDVCIETSPNEDFLCTRQVLETRLMYDGEMINVGVTQRVDGVEEEKQAIRDVLHQMDMYFFTEVLALPEYSFARSRW